MKPERTQRGKGRAHRERQVAPSFVGAVISGANRGGNSREELKATSVEVIFLMNGLTMLRAQSHQPYAIRVIAAAK